MGKTGKKVIAALCGTVLLIALLRGCVATSYLIPSDGMENALYRGERILVDKWSYGLRAPFMGLWGYHRWGGKSATKGDIVVFNNPAESGSHAIDHRRVFIGRCIGIPGDTLQVDSLFSVISTTQSTPDRKTLYAYPQSKEKELVSLLSDLGIESANPCGQDSLRSIRGFSRYEYYLLTQALADSCWLVPLSQPDTPALRLVVPGRGISVKVEPWNRTLLCNTLLLHEGRRAEVKGDTLYIDGRPTMSCRFSKDYYWVASDNSLNLSDSRLFGFVPEEHLIGRAALIWYSDRRERIGQPVQ